MKIGFRTPSLKRSIKARTTGRAKRSMKRAINPYYGKKGMGWVRDPKKAMYNKVYNKTTFGLSDIEKKCKDQPDLYKTVGWIMVGALILFVVSCSIIL